MYAVYPQLGGAWQILRISEGRAQLVAIAVDEQHAERIRDLLERHGLVDVPLDQVETHGGT